MKTFELKIGFFPTKSFIFLENLLCPTITVAYPDHHRGSGAYEAKILLFPHDRNRVAR